MASHKVTCLSLIEREYDAKMAPVGAWQLAKNFPGGATSEERHTRTYCSVFNRCHTERMRVTGKGIVAAVSRLITGTEELYPVDSCVYGASGNDKFTMLVMADDDILLLSDRRGAAAELLAEVDGIELCDLSDVLAHLVVAGEKLDDVLNEFDLAPENRPETGKTVRTPVAEVNTILLNAPELPVPALSLIFNAEYAEGMWEEFVDTHPVKPAGFAAYDALTQEDAAEEQ